MLHAPGAPGTNARRRPVKAHAPNYVLDATIVLIGVALAVLLLGLPTLGAVLELAR